MRNFNITISGVLNQEISNIHLSVPGDEFYLIDKETQQAIKVDKLSIKKIFSTSLEKLKEVLTEIVERNVKVDVYELARNEFDKIAKEYFAIQLYTEKLLRFKATVEELPETANIGDIYKKDGDFFVFHETDQYKKILTIQEVEDVLRNFYTKEEIDEIFANFQAELNEFRTSTLNSLNEFISILNDHTVTKSEFNEKIDYYSEQLQFLNESFNALITNWNTELSSMQAYKDDIQLNFNTYAEKYQNLLSDVSDIRQEIVNININNTELSNSISSIFELFNDYNEIISGLTDTVNVLSAQLIELSRFDQEVLNQ